MGLFLPSPLLSFNGWQAWRAGPGKRPAKKKGDSVSVRVKWKAVFLGDAEQKETLEVTAQPSTEIIPVQRVITKVHLLTARQLDQAGYRYDRVPSTEKIEETRREGERREEGVEEYIVLLLSRPTWRGWQGERLPRPGGWLMPPPARSLHPLLRWRRPPRPDLRGDCAE